MMQSFQQPRDQYNTGLKVFLELHCRPSTGEKVSIFQRFLTVEDTGLEPVTFWLPAKRSPN
jgi:hypothetical protein